MKLTDAVQVDPLHRPARHESGYLHVTGEAEYVDDLPAPRGMRVGWIVTSPHARATIDRVDATAAEAIEGIDAVLFANAVPGTNRIGPLVHDEPVLADGEVHYVGQPVALVIGDSYESVKIAASLVVVEYTPTPAVTTLAAAIEGESFFPYDHTIARGEVDAAIASAPVVIEGEVGTPAQDHFYLETQAALAVPEEAGAWTIYSSTQHPTEIQKMVAEVLGIAQHQIVTKVPRLGGGFGGKESQASAYACLAALGAWAVDAPVRIWLNRDEDMRQTGKRHPFFSRYRAGFDEQGRIVGLDVQIYSDAGWSLDLSPAVMDRALFHLDSSYYIEHVRFRGRLARTNLPSNTAFRGFGGPQGMFVTEEVFNRAAERLGLDPAAVREANFYGDAPRDRTPYGQVVKNNRLGRLYQELLASSEYAERRAEIDAFNQSSRFIKRGLGFQPVKFGISFTKSLLNQAGAFVLVYSDGSVQLNHGGTEMGQGLHTKMLAVCAHELGVPVSAIRVMTTATDKVPNTSPTAASSGSDLNGQAVAVACRELRTRMAPIAAELLGLQADDADALVFVDGRVQRHDDPERSVAFSEVTMACWLRRVSLSATGFYRTPGIHYDADKGRGTPFFYYAFGGAVIEVEVHGLTGEHRMRRVDILHDVGNSLVPTIDRGQVEGAFVQGVGWLTCEEVLHDPEDGRPLTTGPSTYKIPASGDVPEDFRVELLDRAPAEHTIHGSKAVGEPPFMLGIATITALRHAIAGFGPKRNEVELQMPATPEAILRAVTTARDAS